MGGAHVPIWSGVVSGNTVLRTPPGMIIAERVKVPAKGSKLFDSYGIRIGVVYSSRDLISGWQSLNLIKELVGSGANSKACPVRLLKKIVVAHSEKIKELDIEPTSLAMKSKGAPTLSTQDDQESDATSLVDVPTANATVNSAANSGSDDNALGNSHGDDLAVGAAIAPSMPVRWADAAAPMPAQRTGVESPIDIAQRKGEEMALKVSELLSKRDGTGQAGFLRLEHHLHLEQVNANRSSLLEMSMYEFDSK